MLQVAKVGISNLSWVLLFLVLVLENLHLGLGILSYFLAFYNLVQSQSSILSRNPAKAAQRGSVSGSDSSMSEGWP